MKFEWDEDKNRLNLRKHDVDFAEAEEVFDDLNSIESLDALHSDEETRFRRLGLSGRRLLFLIYTVREVNGEETVRFISARKAGAREVIFYNESNKF